MNSYVKMPRELQRSPHEAQAWHDLTNALGDRRPTPRDVAYLLALAVRLARHRRAVKAGGDREQARADVVDALTRADLFWNEAKGAHVLLVPDHSRRGTVVFFRHGSNG